MKDEEVGTKVVHGTKVEHYKSLLDRIKGMQGSSCARKSLFVSPDCLMSSHEMLCSYTIGIIQHLKIVYQILKNRVYGIRLRGMPQKNMQKLLPVVSRQFHTGSNADKKDGSGKFEYLFSKSTCNHNTCFGIEKPERKTMEFYK